MTKALLSVYYKAPYKKQNGVVTRRRAINLMLVNTNVVILTSVGELGVVELVVIDGFKHRVQLPLAKHLL